MASLRTELKNALLSLISNNVGGVYVEALSLVPVLIILWAGVMFMHRQYDTDQKARMFARQCAWEYSNGGCRQIPAVCKSTPALGEALKDPPEIGTKLEAGGGGTIMDAVGAIFGKPATVHTRSKLARPNIFGGGSLHIKASQYLMCNEQARNPFDTVLGVATELGDGLW